MSTEDFSQAGTLQLARELVRCSQRFERMVYAKGWRDPLWWCLGQTFVKDRMREKLPKLTVELALRYRGVLREMFRSVGMNGGALTEAITEAWLTTVDEMRVTRDYRLFSRIVWRAATAQAGVHPNALKPKLMLRQFVDEMPDCDQRGALRAVGYGEDVAEARAQEILRLLSSGYSILHDQLLRHSEELDVLTDSLFSTEIIKQFGEPYVQYEEWLFFA
jgi:hypothetical protein